MLTFELILGYTWWAIFHAVLQGQSHVQVDSCCILFEYSLMHVHEATFGTHVFTQNVPVSIFEQEILRVLTELNANEITRIMCARITTCDFPTSLNQAVQYIDII